MFKRYFEAPEDQGQQVIVVPDEPVDAAQLIVDRINEVNSAADAAEGGEVPSADATSSGGSEGGEDAGPGTAEDLILGRFKTTDDVVTAYQNLEPEYTQTRQQMREMERQLAELQAQLEYTQDQPSAYDRDFEFEAPFSNSPKNVEELEALAEQHPDRAAMFAIQNAERLPGELVQEVVNYWHTRNPAQATAYMLQQMFQGYLPQIDARLAPHDNSRQEGIVQRAVDMAEGRIGPDYSQYHDRIVDAIEANPAFLPQDVNDPEAMSQSIVNVYAMLVGMDQLERGKQLAAQGAPPPAVPNPAATQTRPAAVPSGPASASQEDIEAARNIQNLILNARG